MAKPFEQGRNDRARCSPAPVGIVVHTLMTLDPRVHQHIGRPAIETACRSVRMQQAPIGNAAQIENAPGFLRGTKDSGVECRHQWRTLPACRDIAAPEVTDDRDAGQLGQQGQVGQLEGITAFRRVADGLSMATNGPHRFAWQVLAGQ